MNQVISREELLGRMNSGQQMVLLEALPERYFDAEHLPGARQIPHDPVLLAAVAPGLIPGQDAFVVVYCSNAQCQNSETAARTLRELGYRNVHKYAGGKQDWAAAGLTLESGKAACLSSR